MIWDMGIESANYMYSGGPRTRVEQDQLLRQLGAEGVLGAPNQAVTTYAIRSTDHWIDLRLDTSGRVELRVALCNPTAVLGILHKTLTSLMADGGTLLDRWTGESVTHLDDAGWQKLEDAFVDHRAGFRSHFGTFEAAISGDRVFEYIRQHSGQ
jgi:hypothetical protein